MKLKNLDKILNDLPLNEMAAKDFGDCQKDIIPPKDEDKLKAYEEKWDGEKGEALATKCAKEYVKNAQERKVDVRKSLGGTYSARAKEKPSAEIIALLKKKIREIVPKAEKKKAATKKKTDEKAETKPDAKEETKKPEDTAAESKKQTAILVKKNKLANFKTDESFRESVLRRSGIKEDESRESDYALEVDGSGEELEFENKEKFYAKIKELRGDNVNFTIIRPKSEKDKEPTDLERNSFKEDVYFNSGKLTGMEYLESKE